jgi:hypothetical protein
VRQAPPQLGNERFEKQNGRRYGLNSHGPLGPRNAFEKLSTFGEGLRAFAERCEHNSYQRSCSSRYWSNCSGVIEIRLRMRIWGNAPSAQRRYIVSLLTHNCLAAAMAVRAAPFGVGPFNSATSWRSSFNSARTYRGVSELLAIPRRSPIRDGAITPGSIIAGTVEPFLSRSGAIIPS